jgi:hypothetical protein
MVRHTQSPITDDERQRLEIARRRFVLNKLFRKAKAHTHKEEKFVDVYQVSAERCFIPADLNEEVPLYFLDLGGMVLILFGPWMLDPHALIASAGICEEWNCEKMFFRTFSLRCLASEGTVFQLSVESADFLAAEPLPAALRFKRLRECELIHGQSTTLLRDLESAGIIEPT